MAGALDTTLTAVGVTAAMDMVTAGVTAAGATVTVVVLVMAMEMAGATVGKNFKYSSLGGILPPLII